MIRWLRRLCVWFWGRAGDFLAVPGAALRRRPYYHITDWGRYLGDVGPGMNPEVYGRLRGSTAEHHGWGLYVRLASPAPTEYEAYFLASYLAPWVGDLVYVGEIDLPQSRKESRNGEPKPQPSNQIYAG